jgi:hypothetical protein
MGSLSSIGEFTQETAKLRATLSQAKQYNNTIQNTLEIRDTSKEDFLK